jgi:uncharacterized protein
MSKIASPCINLCLLDPQTQLCEGCGRTAFEIGNWLAYTHEQRRVIIKSLGRRLKEFRQKKDMKL